MRFVDGIGHGYLLPLPRPAGEGRGEGSHSSTPPHARSLTKRTDSTSTARQLRQDQSPPEVILWKHLRAARLGGFKFRRQHPVGPFVLDFYCQAAGLCVEVDSRYHESRRSQDNERDAWLAERGIETLRVMAGDVSSNLDGVLSTILRRCRRRVAAIEAEREQKKQ
ncbi:MAG: DUF559 domain-containing protein [Planctomycetota bacterium]